MLLKHQVFRNKSFIVSNGHFYVDKDGFLATTPEVANVLLRIPGFSMHSDLSLEKSKVVRSPWVFTKPSTWEFYDWNSNKLCLTIEGISLEPTMNEDLTTLELLEIPYRITNNFESILSISGEVIGILSSGAEFDVTTGLKNKSLSSDYIYTNNTLYLRGSKLVGISGNLGFEFKNGELQIKTGTLDIENCRITGNTLLSITYEGIAYIVQNNKLKRFSKRQALKLD